MTRQIALLSDIHGNLEALDAALLDLDRRAPEARIVCAGDVVGYGPDPEACLDRLLERDAVIVRGNHEEMVLGWRDDDACVCSGILAVAWTREHLSRRAMGLLAALPPVADLGELVVCHGDLDDAGTYVSGAARAAAALARLRELHPAARLLVCGHTHHAMCFSARRGLVPVRCSTADVDVDAGPWLLNPGAVGQAREGVALASYALLDLERGAASFLSLGYDHATTIQKMRRAGLTPEVVLTPPRGVARRLAHIKARAARLWVRTRPQLAELGLRVGTQIGALVGAVDLGGDVGGQLGLQLGSTARGRASIDAPDFPKPSLRRRVLAAAQKALHASGASRALNLARSLSGDDGGALILCYHSISTGEEVPFVDPRFSVPLQVFEQQMRFLSNERHVLSMSDLVDRLRRGAPIPPRSVVVTFDDGYLSNFRVAAPVLDRLRLPSLIYLPTGQISRAQPQFIDVLHGAFALRTRDTLDVPQAGLHNVALRDRQVVQRAYRELEDRLCHMTLRGREEVLALIVDQLRPSRPTPRLTMTWDDVIELRTRYPRFEVGVHTRDHVDLTACDADTAGHELRSCISDFRMAVGRDPDHFAFPYGRSCARTRDDASTTSLRSAVVTEPAEIVRRGADVFRLPRLIAPRTMELFPFFTSGAWPDLSRAVLRRA
ncbi:MAG: metallophosphoesterase family protein [Deltaproteobacteria bacterium]|nr:metallophosphoesterase family protein [Deltaproteobacteria bacterium]